MTDYSTSESVWDGVIPCQVHNSEYEVSCISCQSEEVARTDCLVAINEELTNRAQGLTTMGVRVPESVALSVRLELLIDTIYADTRNRMKFEGEAARRMIVELKEAQTMFRDQQTVPKLITPEDKRLHVVGPNSKG